MFWTNFYYYNMYAGESSGRNSLSPVLPNLFPGRLQLHQQLLNNLKHSLLQIAHVLLVIQDIIPEKQIYD